MSAFKQSEQIIHYIPFLIPQITEDINKLLSKKGNLTECHNKQATIEHLSKVEE